MNMERKMFLGAVKRTFQQAEQLRNNMTVAEKTLWNYLKTKPMGLKFRRQHPISKYIVDFYCHALKLVIEVDGGIHNITTSLESDKVRQEYLEAEGLVFLRVTNEEIERDFASVVTKIENFILSIR